MALDIKNKIVLITGASSGIGEAAAHQFAEKGAKVIVAARRQDRIEKLAKMLQEKYGVEAWPLQLDVSDKVAVKEALSALPAGWREIDVLVNNAGLAVGTDKIHEADPEGWDTMIDTNIKGLLYMKHAVLPGMVKRNSGHIINIGSIAGRDCYPGGNIYAATKHAVKALSTSLRIDLLGSAIRVTEIAPGAVHTEFSEVRWKDKSRSDEFYGQFKPLYAEDIADAIVYAATRPLHVDVSEIVIYPTVQASCNLIYRQGQQTKGSLG